MKCSWKMSLVAIGVLGLLAAVSVENAVAAGHGHSGTGGRSMGHSGKSNHFDKGRFDGRYRDFRRPWYGDRYGWYGYGFYPSYPLPLFPSCPTCYEPACPSCFPSNPPCNVFSPSYPCYPSCGSPSYGFGDYCGGWDIYGKPYRHYGERDRRPGDKGGEHRLSPLTGHGNSGGMPSRVASSGGHGSRR